MLIISPNPVPRIHGAALSETNHFFSHRLQNPLPSQASSKSSKWQRSTILSATDCRIHYHPKPVNILPRHSPTKPQGRTDRGEPFLLPPIAESTTIPRQLRTFPCIVLRSHRAERNHFFSHRLLHPRPSEKPVLPKHAILTDATNDKEEPLFQPSESSPPIQSRESTGPKWETWTIFSATGCRIHDHPKPV